MIGNLISACAMALMVGVGALGTIQADVQPHREYDSSLYTCVASSGVQEDITYNAYPYTDIAPYGSGYPQEWWVTKDGIKITSQSGYFAHFKFSNLFFGQGFNQFSLDFEIYSYKCNSYDLSHYVHFDAIQMWFYGLNDYMYYPTHLSVKFNTGLDITQFVLQEKLFTLTGNIASSSDIAFRNGYQVMRSSILFVYDDEFNDTPLEDFHIGFQIYADYLKDQNYAQGYDNGYRDGYDSGYQNGKSDGYRAGYRTALDELSENHTFMSLFNSIADTPLRFIYGLFNFDLFGTSVIVIVMSLLTGVIILTIIKKVWK